MKRLLIIILMLIGFLPAVAQSNSYVYVEGYKNIPFKLKLDDDVQKEISQNFYILSSVSTGIHKLSFMFSTKQYPDQEFNIYIKENGSHGFKLSLDKNNIFYLEDLVTQKSIYKYSDINDLVNSNKKADLTFKNKELDKFKADEKIKSRQIKSDNNTKSTQADVYDLINEASPDQLVAKKTRNENGGGDDDTLFQADDQSEKKKDTKTKSGNAKTNTGSKTTETDKKTIAQSTKPSSELKPIVSPNATNTNPRYLGDNIKENKQGEPVTQTQKQDLTKLSKKERKQYEKALQLKNKLEQIDRQREEEERKKKEAELARLKQIEIEKARLAAEKEAKRLADEKKKQEEIARKKAEDEEKARIEAERIAIAKAKQAEADRIAKEKADLAKKNAPLRKDDPTTKSNNNNNNNATAKNNSTPNKTLEEPKFIDRNLGQNNTVQTEPEQSSESVATNSNSYTPKTYSSEPRTYKKRPKTLEEAVRNKYRYNGNCKQLASEEYMVSMFAKLEAKPDDEARMKIVNKMILEKNCYSCEDIEQLSQAFNTQNGKFDFMKKMFPYIYDGEDEWPVLQSVFGQRRFREAIQDEFQRN